MAISGVLTYAGLTLEGIDGADFLFAVVVLGVILSELSGPFLTQKVLERAGEIQPPPRATNAASARVGEQSLERRTE
jgi:hypothetical protein